MRLYLSILFIIVSFYGCSIFSIFKGTIEPRAGLKQEIDAILRDSIFTSTMTGIKIVSLDKNEVLYERNSKILFHPASTLKLLTSVAAYHELGKDYTFKTKLYADKILSDGTIPGNIYLKGFGNPDLTTNDLDTLASRLRTRGVIRILGSIVIDNSFFDDQIWGNGWMWDDDADPDEAYISPLSVNKNSVEVTVIPGFQVDTPAIITLQPQTSFIQIINRTKTVRDSVQKPLEIKRPSELWPNTIIVEGEISILSPWYKQTISLKRPELYSAELLKEILMNKNLMSNSPITVASVPQNAIEIASHEIPLDSVLTHLLKISDNLSAENTLKVLSSQHFSSPASSKNGVFIVNHFISSLGIDTVKYRMVDGSGVSRYNLITPDGLIQILSAIYTQKDLFTFLYNSLPIAGIDGTLKNRMQNTRAQGNLRAKTGTLNGASCLAGYVRTLDGEMIAFSIMMQNYLFPLNLYHRAQDKIGTRLASFSRSPKMYARYYKNKEKQGLNSISH